MKDSWLNPNGEIKNYMILWKNIIFRIRMKFCIKEDGFA